MKTVAILSPAQNAYSETFIQAHKKLPFTIKYYFNGFLPTALEADYSMMELPYKDRLQKKILKGFSANEKKILFSLKKERVDAVLAEYGPTAAECLNVIKYLKLPLIVHFHGYDACVNSVLEHYQTRYKEVFAYASKVIVVSKKMYGQLESLGCPSSKLLINYYGPNDSFFKVSPTYTGQEFIAIGRFVEKKAPHLTILAFQKVLQDFPSAKLKMIGEGVLLPVCRDLVIELNMEDNVEFLGVQNVETIQRIMKNSIALVQHSVTASDGDSEGTPVAVLEAQAAGLPVIATYHAGIPDVVVNGETGLLVNEKDVEGMAMNMKRALSESGLSQKLGEAGRERVREKFTMERHLEVLTEAINKAIS